MEKIPRLLVNFAGAIFVLALSVYVSGRLLLTAMPTIKILYREISLTDFNPVFLAVVLWALIMILMIVGLRFAFKERNLNPSG